MFFSNILKYVLANKPEGGNPKQIFHGGCHGCKMQDRVGTLLCSKCQYFDADWGKPNLNGSGRRERKWLNKIKFFSKLASDTTVEKPVIFHGGCHGCTSQQTHGIKRCTGCQFFEANWSLPDLNNSRH